MTTFDPDELVIDGLVNFSEMVGDNAVARAGGVVYRSVKDAFGSFTPEDFVPLAFPTMIIRPNIRTECLVVVFHDRITIAWRKGTFKKTTEQVTIPLSTISSADWHVSNVPSTKGATLMEIKSAAGSETIALPKQKTEFANNLQQLLVTG